MPERICDVDGCDRDREVRDWCDMHYRRWRRHGSPTAGRTPVGEPERWLEEHLEADPSDECVDWPFSSHERGYGFLWVDGRNRTVTHVVLERTGRPRPTAPDDHALHSCDRPSCVNPAHLRWGSNADNIDDREVRDRTHRILSDADVAAIREEAGRVTHRELAERYDVDRTTITHIVNGERAND